MLKRFIEARLKDPSTRPGKEFEFLEFIRDISECYPNLYPD